MKVLIADDHMLVRRGLRHIIERKFRDAVIGEAGSVDEVMSELRKESYDLLILDINMPGRSGLEALDELRDNPVPVLVLSMHPEDRIAVRALKSGASGYLTKDSAPEQLAEAMEEAAKAEGLSDHAARTMVLQTILGAARILTETEEEPTELRKRVTSPNGTTQAAIETFQQGGFATLVGAAIHAASERGKELSAAND